MARPSLRKVGTVAAAGCAALFATKAARRRRGARAQEAGNPPPHAHAAEDLEALATDEGMPEAPAGDDG
jgi:hypothetical protein